MTDLLKLILGVLASLFRSRAKLEAENLVLRQQINVLRRRMPKRPHLNNIDLLKDAFKLNMDLIYGYRGNALDLAVERGEVHASGGDLIGFMGSRPRQLLDEGKVKILLQVAGLRNPELDKLNVPWSMDVLPAEHKKLFIMVNPILDLARPYFAPPNVPADRAKLLQTAFANLVKDPDFKAEVKRVAHIEPSLVPGPEMDAAIKQMLSQPKEVNNRVIDLLRGN